MSCGEDGVPLRYNGQEHALFLPWPEHPSRCGRNACIVVAYTGTLPVYRARPPLGAVGLLQYEFLAEPPERRVLWADERDLQWLTLPQLHEDGTRGPVVFATEHRLDHVNERTDRERKALAAEIVLAQVAAQAAKAEPRRTGGRPAGRGLDTRVRHLRDVDNVQDYRDVRRRLIADGWTRANSFTPEKLARAYKRGLRSHAAACPYCLRDP